jgi:ribosomal protein L7Ae-like RNA K-turn-binding protein
VQARTTQPKPKRAVKQFEKSTLNSKAEEFRPPVGLHPNPEDIPFVNFSGARVDSNEPEWAQFLAKKASEKNAQKGNNVRVSGPRQDAPRNAPAAGDFKLQTSEYLKLLKDGEKKPNADAKKRQGPNGSTTNASTGEGNALGDHAMSALKTDFVGALTSMIRLQESGQTDLRNKKKLTPSDAKRMAKRMQEKSGVPGSKEDALLRIAQMLDIQDQEDADEVVQTITAKDDIGIEQQNRDEDLAELAYWSDDDKAPRAVHRASAHKVGHLQFKTCMPREYVTQKLGADLDRNVAMLLLHLRRLNDRHRSFEPDAPSRRRFVVGIKEVFRGVRHGRVKCIILAPDIEEVQTAGGLDDRVKDILRMGYEKDVPVIFALSRVRIGRALGKSLRMSVLAVIDTAGVQDLYNSTIDLAFQKRCQWLDEQPKLKAPEAMKEEPKGKRSGKAQEVTATKDRASGNKQSTGQRRQEQKTPPGKWYPNKN